MKRNWDIFCIVVDNLGDIGFCWRLARQLANEHKLTVRLWVDDLVSFSHIAPKIDISAMQQRVNDVEVCRWQPMLKPVKPADVVIETFACQLPDCYITAMAQLPQPPVWINLEHLSAENWVNSYHCLPSPHPRLPLLKHFFFPGFSSGSGGLVMEDKLFHLRDSFDENAQQTFWQQIGVPARQGEEWRISFFCYDTAPLFELLTQWRQSSVPIYLLIPQLAHSSMAKSITDFFACPTHNGNTIWLSDQLTVQLIPLLEQTEYDQLLWACDFNFVRGEDSFVRAQWAARPFIWHIYPQEDGAHQAKLSAFLDIYTARMTTGLATAVNTFWYNWNGNGNGLIKDSWLVFSENYVELTKHNRSWSKQLHTQKDLACNLQQFIHNQI